MRGLTFALTFMLFGCNDKEALDTSILLDDTDTNPLDTCPNDLDCDGFTDDQDCDPEDPYVNPGMPEIPYDGRDNDCGGDGDLVAVDGAATLGSSPGGDDANDGNPDAHPGADEQCYNPTDEDCDGIAQGYEDNDCDGDGYIDRGDEADDCDAFDAEINPGADEVWYDGIDQDCDEQSDYDADRDGENAVKFGGTDCDDFDATVNSHTTELWDGLDNNCNTILDDVDTADAIQSIEATSTSGEGLYGFVVDVVGDLDGDGAPELIAGAPASDAVSAGAAYITRVSSGDGVPSSIALTSIAGAASNDMLGWDLAAIGDIDGDGLGEVVIGAPGADVAYLLLGSTLDDGGSLSPTDAAMTLSVGEDRFGADVALLGDIDSDGKSEVAVGSGSYTDSTDLWLGVWSGADLAAGVDMDDGDAIALVYGDSTGGETVGGADFDGDGLPDLVVASGVDGTGEIVILSGNDLSIGGDFSVDDLPTLTGPAGVRGGVHNGWLLDANGDGFSELVFSTPDAETADGVSGGGIVYVIDGDDATTSEGSLVGLAVATISGSKTGGAIISLDAGGDFDGDGQSDLVVSDVADAASVLVSTSYVFYGADFSAGGSYTTADRGASFTSDDSQDHTGYSGIAADLDGDGDDDLAIGAPKADVDAGAVFIYESLLVK
ncbi:MAG: hypothetical protein ACI8S6_004197 [Myxococcota bacterium]|jgi:hypothetical protein